MAFVQPCSLSTRLFLSHRPYISSRNHAVFPRTPLKMSWNALPNLACSAPESIPVTEQDVLEAVAESDGKSLPGVRSYENDLARLTLVGAVDFQQALTAAAADGGEAAAEHIASGVPAMVVETVFPGPPDEHSTVSTRLFLPARKVKEKAKRLKNSLTDDILSSTSSRNILAMTFRQVVLQQLWNFELVLFRPGTQRDMEELQNPREVTASFAFSSPDERVISLLGEVVCLTALESTERNFLHNSLRRTANNFLHWFHKHKRIASADSSVTIYKLFEDEIIASAKSLLETFHAKRATFKPLKTNRRCSWWTISTSSKLEKIGGPDFSAWISEYAPAYRLVIDADKLQNVKLEGWIKSANNKWEVLLTHSQMVGLANILDMYYEDVYTLPSKQLSVAEIEKSTSLSNSKRIFSLLKFLSITLASGFFVITISIFRQICLPYLHGGRNYPPKNQSLQSSDVNHLENQAMESSKLEAFCFLIVKKMKDAHGWPGDITTQKTVGAWIGELPAFLRRLGDGDSSYGDMLACSEPLKESAGELKTSMQDIASYQVVLLADGKIIGFQPTSRVAVNHWAANPLAKELYGGRKLSPGLIEPGLKASRRPGEIAVIELLMSVNPDSSFALARPAE